MKKTKILFILISYCSIFLCSCGNSDILTGKEAKIEVINNSALLIDVRSNEEFEINHLGGSINIPLENIEKDAKEKLPNKNKNIIVYCLSGKRSKLAKEKLEELGYTEVYDMGAMSNWYE